MKIKILTLVALASLSFATACGGREANHNTATPMAAATATPLPATTDPALKTTIENELKKKGFNNVTVDVTTTPATLRGTYPKGKLPEMIQTAQLANGGKPLQNQATEEN
jgi:ABC-type glycerol-3-phosphate transport system substrate-binding protein